jgi:ribosomal protein S18 acetylase RimI-like enzyme
MKIPRIFIFLLAATGSFLEASSLISAYIFGFTLPFIGILMEALGTTFSLVIPIFGISVFTTTYRQRKPFDLKNLVLREAKPQDADEIHEVLKQAFKGLEGRGYSTLAINAAIIDANEIRKRILSGGHVLAAELDNEIIGTVTGFKEHQSMHIYSLAVSPKYQRCGVARQLMTYLERIASKEGCNKLFLHTAWVMMEAIKLYESLGYVREGYLRRHFYGEDFIIFSKLIERGNSRCKA